jgi:hypothetical protein
MQVALSCMISSAVEAGSEKYPAVAAIVAERTMPSDNFLYFHILPMRLTLSTLASLVVMLLMKMRPL